MLEDTRSLKKKSLESIIQQKSIKSVFQPIISLKNADILGHEVLSRITGSTEISNTEELFRLAGEYNRVWDLEFLCRTKSLEAAYINMKPPYDKKLFVNVNPRVMHDPKFKEGFTKEYLTRYNIIPGNVIFELTEREAIHDVEGFQKVVEHYKNQQYQIAIDDAGAGYSGLNLISDIRPHYLKLDMKLIRDIHKDNFKYNLVKSFVEFSNITNTKLIAEGIENKDELKTLINLGVQYGQGYFIQRPEEIVKDIEEDIVQYIRDLNDKKYEFLGCNLSNILIESIAKVTNTITPETKVEKVYELFINNKDIYSICVVKDEKVLGIITRENLTLKLCGRYGFSLYQRKGIACIMDKDYMQVECNTPLYNVSFIAMARETSKLYDMIVVSKEGKYYGTVTVKDLLLKTMEIDVANAKNLNPLSGLPGNMIIEQKLAECIHFYSEYSVLYIDIDNFKAYNDVYGIENGDCMIRILANILNRFEKNGIFVGHVGGDDFVIILDNYSWSAVTDYVISQFEKDSKNLYNDADIQQGFVTTGNRKGIIEEYPLSTLTIALVTNRYRSFQDTYELTEELARLKKEGKEIKGSICYTDDFA